MSENGNGRRPRNGIFPAGYPNEGRPPRDDSVLAPPPTAPRWRSGPSKGKPRPSLARLTGSDYPAKPPCSEHAPMVIRAADLQFRRHLLAFLRSHVEHLEAFGATDAPVYAEMSAAVVRLSDQLAAADRDGAIPPPLADAWWGVSHGCTDDEPSHEGGGI